MGVVIPQVVTEDRASEAQFIDGSLRFDSSKSHYLSRTPAGVGTSLTTGTISMWVKLAGLTTENYLFSAGNDTSDYFIISINTSNQIRIFTGENGATNLNLTNTVAVFRDPSAWYHLLIQLDWDNAISSDRIKLFVNGIRVTLSGTFASQGYTGTRFNRSFPHRIGSHPTGAAYLNGFISNFYIIDGQALTPSSFGYTDPLTNTWRPKRYTGSYGTNGFYLPMDGNTPIGQDRSGNNNNWTPVNFGGSNTLEKATGALPILNTDGGGKVARVGVRTDSNASSLVLALPLVGIKSDFSNAINSGTSNKAITANGNATASSARSNFYGGSFVFDGVGDYLETSTSNDFVVGTGDFTLEGWFNVDASQTTNARLFGQNINNSSNWDCYIDGTSGTNGIYMHGNAVNLGMSFPSANTWHHFCIVRSSGVLYSFMNGVLRNTQAYTNSVGVNNFGFRIGEIGPNGGSGYTLKGYVQDFRLYKGLAKYTQNFIPASTDPDILPDTPSGVAYSSNVALVPSTDGGAVAFTGSSGYLSLADSADFDLNTSFTIDLWYYQPAAGDACFLNRGGGSANWTNSGHEYLLFIESGTLYWMWNNSLTTAFISTSAPAAGVWHHLAVGYNGTTTNFWLDGRSLGTSTSGYTLPTTRNITRIGYSASNQLPLTGFISNLSIIKGTDAYGVSNSIITPPTAPITSVANTKLLCCKSQTSATAFDVSPGTITANGNATASNFNPFTVNINTQRGQESGYCTLNPLDQAGSNTFSNGNLNTVVAADNNAPPTVVCGSSAVSSGKWYWEVDQIAATTAGGMIGVGDCGVSVSFRSWRSTGGWYYYGNSGQKYNNGSGATYGSSYTTNDTISVVLDMDVGSISFYKNGVNQGVAYNTGLSGKTIVPSLANGTGGGTQSYAANFGQKPFKFPPPAGFQPLALANTPRPTIVRPDQYVGIVTYTGNGGTLSLTTGFKPDFVWIKDRTVGYNHRVHDSVRGVGTNKHLYTNSTAAEGSETANNNFVSFDTNGFTLGSTSSTNGMNSSGTSFVAWAWKAGGNSNTYNINDVGYATASAAGLTAGTITPTGASVNTKSGFSIITYTGNNTVGATISHGLGRVPAFAIFKNRGASSDWQVYHQSLGNATSIILQTTAAAGSSSAFNSTSPTSTLFTFGQGTSLNSSGGTHVGYLWAEIPGFSKFGSYIGNGSADGPVIITGFRPRWVLLKNISDGYDGGGSIINSHSWVIYDTSRNVNNPSGSILAPNKAFAEENNSTDIDFLSNGFKIRTNRSNINPGSTQTVIYAAFAESPSFNLYGGQANAR